MRRRLLIQRVDVFHLRLWSGLRIFGGLIVLDEGSLLVLGGFDAGGNLLGAAFSGGGCHHGGRLQFLTALPAFQIILVKGILSSRVSNLWQNHCSFLIGHLRRDMLN